MTFADALTHARAAPLDEDQLDALARASIGEGEEAQALALLASAARQLDSTHLWHWAGVLHRALDNHVEAFAAFSEALRLDPTNQAIAHALARTALEAGWDSAAHFEKALALGQPSSEILLGLAAARFARGDGDQAAADIEQILQQVPTWFDGHRQLSQLRSLLGEPSRMSESFERALLQHPADDGLWGALLDHNIAASDFEALDETVRRARDAGVSHSLDSYEAIAAGELGDAERADRLFARPDAPALWKVRHLLRTGRIDESLPLIDAAIDQGGSKAIWPYALTAWRAAGDARLEWLTGEDGFVAVIDLAKSLPFLNQLNDSLRSLHQMSGQFLDQSVQHGTQTDGPLLSRTQPEFRALREVIQKAVADFVADLPDRDSRHPFLGPRRDRPIRFAGSWSVRLGDAGFHDRHVHNKGWISSALYLALPGDKVGDAGENGTLELGAPPEGLNLDQAPMREIAPAVGRLVLFPSWLWHGTRPFAAGERLTVAFDVRTPI